MTSKLCTRLKRTLWVVLCVTSTFIQFARSVVILQDSIMDTLPLSTGMAISTLYRWFIYICISRVCVFVHIFVLDCMCVLVCLHMCLCVFGCFV